MKRHCRKISSLPVLATTIGKVPTMAGSRRRVRPTLQSTSGMRTRLTLSFSARKPKKLSGCAIKMMTLPTSWAKSHCCSSRPWTRLSHTSSFKKPLSVSFLPQIGIALPTPLPLRTLTGTELEQQQPEFYHGLLSHMTADEREVMESVYAQAGREAQAAQLLLSEQQQAGAS